MKCATHPEGEVIGVCCNCGRAVCKVCAGAGVNKLACSPQCADQLTARDAVINAVLSKTNRSNRAGGVLCMVSGGVFTLLGLYHALFDRHAILIFLGLGLGLSLLTAGISLMRTAQKNR